jgi:hypothetical protein
MNKWNVELRKQFENINKTEIEKRKNFISDLLTEGCDEDRYERCFKIADGKFLCRSGLSVVLKLSRGMQKKIVPTAVLISHRYRALCIAEIFSALAVYRDTMLQKRPSRRDRTYEKKNIRWSHPCFKEAIKKVRRIRTYRVHGIKHFASQMGITAAIKEKKIFLGAPGDPGLDALITSLNGCLINLAIFPEYKMVINELYNLVLGIPPNCWKTVSKISMSHLNGRPIEFTSSSHSSIVMWVKDHAKNNKMSTFSQQTNGLISMVKDLEMMIASHISNFVHGSTAHIVRLQPGALRSKPGSVPQRAHRDFTLQTYKEKFPGQVYIGFMPITSDGMFLQVWDGPGEANLLFIPYGKFLLLPGNTIHAGWMCTSLLHQNHRLHFYIIVSENPNEMSRKEDQFFENMNTYLDEESSERKELFISHYNCLAEFLFK